MGGYGYGVSMGQRVSPGEELFAKDVKAPAGFGSRVHPEAILYPGSLMSIEERMVAGGKLGQIYDVPLGQHVGEEASFNAQVLTELMPVNPRVVGQGGKGYPEVGPLGLEYREGPPETYTMYGDKGTPGYPTPKRFQSRVAGGELGIIVGAIASVGLKAATPSITKTLKSAISGKSAKEARSSRIAAQNMLVIMHTTTKAIADGTDELIAIHNGGQRVDPLQLMEADVMLQGALQAWGQTANNYAALMGAERGLGQADIYPSSAVPFYMQGRNRMGQHFKARQQGNAPAHESDIEYERFFLRGYGIELGRSEGQKRADRGAWLALIQSLFFKEAKRANKNLDFLFKAYGMTRNTPQEAKDVIENIPEQGTGDQIVAALEEALTEKPAVTPQAAPKPYAVPPAVRPATQHEAPSYPDLPGMPGYAKKKEFPIVPVAAATGGAIGLVALLKILNVF